jgi:hypothetical protein
MGFREVGVGPFVRSSYHANHVALSAQGKERAGAAALFLRSATSRAGKSDSFRQSGNKNGAPPVWLLSVTATILHGTGY